MELWWRPGEHQGYHLIIMPHSADRFGEFALERDEAGVAGGDGGSAGLIGDGGGGGDGGMGQAASGASG